MSGAKRWLECLESRNFEPLVSAAGESSSLVDSLVLKIWCGGNDVPLHEFYKRVLENRLDGTAREQSSVKPGSYNTLARSTQVKLLGNAFPCGDAEKVEICVYSTRCGLRASTTV